MCLKYNFKNKFLYIYRTNLASWRICKHMITDAKGQFFPLQFLSDLNFISRPLVLIHSSNDHHIPEFISLNFFTCGQEIIFTFYKEALMSGRQVPILSATLIKSNTALPCLFGHVLDAMVFHEIVKHTIVI